MVVHKDGECTIAYILHTYCIYISYAMLRRRPKSPTSDTLDTLNPSSLGPPHPIAMAAHRRVQSARAGPGHPAQLHFPPISLPDAPEYDYNPHDPQPPPPPPRSFPRAGLSSSSSSSFAPEPPTLAFPDPQLFRSASVSAVPGPTLTVSDYGAGDVLSPTYSITDAAFDPASFSLPNNGLSSGFPTPYGGGRQFSESSYSFGDAYSFTTSESPERSPSLTHSQLR